MLEPCTMNVLILNLLVFLLLILPFSSTEECPVGDCFPDYDTNSKAYDDCKTNLCFLVLPEPPFVIRNDTIEEKLRLEKPVPPIPCKSEEFQGIFFDILKRPELKEEHPDIKNAKCIYAGSNCSFDGTICFMQESQKKNTGHRFIAGGFFSFLPNRRTPFTINSAPVVTTSMTLVYNRSRVLNTFNHARHSIFSPFEGGAWGMVALFAVILVLCFALYLVTFCPHREFRPAIEWILAGKQSQNPYEATSWRTLKVSVTVFLAVLILLYEVGIAVLLFRGGDPLIRDMDELKNLNLNKLIVAQAGASERILRHYTDNPAELPWERGTSLEGMVEKLVNGTADYLFSFDKFVNYVINEKELCNRMTGILLGLQQVGGFYYGANIPVEIRDSIDKGLLALQLSRMVSEAENQYGNVPPDCGSENQNVDIRVMFLLLLITVGPLLILFLLFFATTLFTVYLDRRNRLQAPTENENENEERNLIEN